MPATRKPLQVSNAVESAEEASRSAIKSSDKDASTPTKVLRSGRRVAATPGVPASARRGPARVAVHPPLDSHLKAPARRVPAADEATKTNDKEGYRGPATRRRALRVLADSEQADSETDASDRLVSGASALSTGLDSSPVLGLVQSPGNLTLEAGPPPERPPAGLLTAVREAQRDVRDEGRLSALCAEIQGLQQEVQRESGSDGGASAAVSSAASGDRYQDTPSSRQVAGGFHGLESVTVASDSPRRSASAQPQPNLVPLEQALLGGSSSGSEFGGYSDEEESPPDSPRAAASLATGIRGQLAALRLSQEGVRLEGQALLAAGLDTDGSDAADKLEALRTRLGPGEASSPAPAELHELAALEGGSEQAGDGAGCPAFLARPAAPAPSFMDRKLRSLQEAEWGSELDPRPHVSALERAKHEAAEARRQSLGSADKAATRRLVRGAVERAVQSEGRGLGEVMVKHKCRLEREKEAHAAAALASAESQESGRRAPAATAAPGQGLCEGARPHKHRLQAEKEAAAAARKTGEDPTAPLPGYMRPTAAFRHAHPGEALGAGAPHRSRLEREKAVAAASGAEEPRRAPLTARHTARDTTWGDLGSMKVHKSRLEREKEEASRRGSGQATHRRAPRMAAPTAAWEGVRLSAMKPHKSQMEKEVAAWKAADRQQQLQRE